jgi:hypothetical protein
MHGTDDGAAYREEQGSDGHTIHVVMADYQEVNNGEGWLRLLRFSPADDTIYTTTYSPYLEMFRTTEAEDHLNLDYAMEGSAPFTLLGTVEDIASGTQANFPWKDLSDGLTYEWYAVVNDGTNQSTSNTWSFTTLSANQAPVIDQGDSTPVSMSEDGSPDAFIVNLSASDPDLTDTLTWSLAGQATNGVATVAGTGVSPLVTYTPIENYFGPDSFVAQVADGHGGVDTITVNVTVTPVNDAPTITSQDTLSTNEDTPLTITLADLLVTDPDNTYPNGFTLAVASGENYTANDATITPADNFNGALIVPVTVNDGTANSSPFNLTVNVTPVNDAPLANGHSYATALNTVVVVNLTGSDVESSPLTFAIVTPPQHGALSGTMPALTYTPDQDYGGTDQFTFRAYDGELYSLAATIIITVNNGNAPVSTFYGEIHIVANPPEVGDEVQAYVSGYTDPIATTEITQPGTILTYIIDVPIQSVDTLGCTSGDPILFEIRQRVVAVGTCQVAGNVALNFHPPEALAGGPYTGQEGKTIAFSASTNDWLENEVVAYQWDWENDGAFDANGASATHSWATTGQRTIGLRVTDQQGGQGFTTVTVEVTANVAPAITPIATQNVNELETLAFTVSASDVDLPLSYSLVGAPDGANIGASNGAFSWTPTETQGPHSYAFAIEVCDSSSEALCAQADVTVSVSEVNVAPVLGAIGNQQVEQTYQLAFLAVASDVDLPDNDLTFSLQGTPTGASIDPASGAFNWTPSTEQAPDDYLFIVKVCDNGQPQLCDQEAITVTVLSPHTLHHSITLGVGWNLVSFNLHPTSTDIADVLASIEGSYDLVYAWDASGAHAASSGNWLRYDNVAYTPDTLTTLDESVGFWIHMTQADTLEITASQCQTARSISLSTGAGGWNLVGYPSAANGALPGVITENGAAGLTLIYAYHLGESDPWRLYDATTAIPLVNDLTELTPGWGYWVKVDQQSTWSVGY